MEQVLATILSSYWDVLSVLIVLPITAISVNQWFSMDSCINHINKALLFFLTCKFLWLSEDFQPSYVASKHLRFCSQRAMCLHLCIAAYLLDCVFAKKTPRVSGKSKLLTYASYYTIILTINILQTTLIRFGELGLRKSKTHCSFVNGSWIDLLELLQLFMSLGFAVYLLNKNCNSRVEKACKIQIYIIQSLIGHEFFYLSMRLDKVLVIMPVMFVAMSLINQKFEYINLLYPNDEDGDD